MPTSSGTADDRAVPTGRSKPRLLVAMAHANDMEYYAGGTVAKFAGQGYEVVLVMMSANICGADLDGDGNYLKHTPDQVKPVREAETHAGAQELGVESIVQVGFKDSIYFENGKLAWLGEPEYDMRHPSGSEPLPAAAANQRCIDRVQHVLERYQPEIVITHNFSSGFEHTCVAHIVNQAFGAALRKGAKLGSLWVPAHVRHGAWESDVRLYPSPNILIDVTDQWTTKLRAIRAHRSQNVEGSIKKVEIIGRYWGMARQCRYAEPFFTVIDARYT